MPLDAVTVPCSSEGEWILSAIGCISSLLLLSQRLARLLCVGRVQLHLKSRFQRRFTLVLLAARDQNDAQVVAILS